tara:strand:+ start:2780 stop:3580 length:801 start_codon:yes stop_codon:yes gene_type:complete
MKINLISESGGQQAIRQHQNRTNAWSSPRNRAFRRDANMGRAMGAIRSGESGVVNPDLVSNNSYHDRESHANPRTGVFGGTEDNNSIPRSWAGRNPFRASTLSKEISSQHRASQALNSKGTNRRLNIINPNQPLFKTGATPGYNPSPVRHTQGAFGKAPASATGMRANPPSTPVSPTIEAPHINPAIGNKVSDRTHRTGLRANPPVKPSVTRMNGTLPPPKGTLPPSVGEEIRRGASRDAHMSATRPVNPTDSPIRRVIQRMPNGR